MNVSGARAKRRHVNRHLTQTVIQVFSELTALDGVGKIHVGRRDYADVRFLHLGRTDADEFTCFKTRNKRTWVVKGNSATSSRKMVPPFASSK